MPRVLNLHLTLDESKTLARRRRGTNWVIFGLLAAFVAAVYLISFSHIRTETNEPWRSFESGNMPVTDA